MAATSSMTRYWTTQPGPAPGVIREGQRYRVRICHGTRWLHLGTFASEWLAGRFAVKARRLNRRGVARLAATPSAAARRALLEQLLLLPEYVRPEARQGAP